MRRRRATVRRTRTVPGAPYVQPSVRSGAAYHRFDLSWSDAVELASDPATHPPHRSFAHQAGFEHIEFQGTRDFAGARTLALSGWPEGLRRVTRIVADLPIPERTQPVYSYDVAGWYSDPVRVIAGDHRCMVTQTDDRVSTQIDILVGASYLADVHEEEIFRRGAAIVSTVDALEDAGVRCSIIGAYSSNPPGGTGGGSAVLTHRIVIKRPEEPLDRDRLIFAFGHRAMFRRIVFGLREILPEPLRQQWGAGRDVGAGFGRSCDDIPDPGQVFIPRGMSDPASIRKILYTAAEQSRTESY